MKLFNQLVKLGMATAVSLFVMKAETANAASLSYSIRNIPGGYSGIIEGEDNNSDGFLTQNELTSFSFSGDEEGLLTDLSGLYSFGTLNLVTQVWDTDASGWGSPSGFYFSWDNGYRAVESIYKMLITENIIENNIVENNIIENTIVSNTSVSPQSTPEPASILGILAISAIGTASWKRKKQRKT